MSNSTTYIKITSDMTKWVNSRWPPRWPPKSVDGHNFCLGADSVINQKQNIGFEQLAMLLDTMK